MSTDLQLLCDLPKIRLLAVDSPPPTEFSTSAPSTTAAGCNSDAIHPEDRREDEEDCRTPTSEENRIPAVLTCPPAPRKPRLALKRKRKLSELEYFEILNSAGIDEIFRQVPERVTSDELPKKKRVSKRIAA